MSTSHTPGPWFTFANGQCVGGPVGSLGNPSGAGTSGVAHCGMGLRTAAEVEANARLIAAAPELLESLQALCLLFGHRADDSTARGCVMDAHAVITKATGRPA